MSFRAPCRPAVAGLFVLTFGLLAACLQADAVPPSSSGFRDGLPLDTFHLGGTNTLTIDFVAFPASANPGSPFFCRLTNGVTRVGAVPYAFRLSRNVLSQGQVKALQAAHLPELAWLPTEASAYPDHRMDWGDDRPAMHFNHYMRMHLVNWLNRQKGFHDAYRFDADGQWQLWEVAESWQLDGRTNRYRHKDCFYFLPSLDEFHKAVYWDPVRRRYWKYPFGSDQPPRAVPRGQAPGTLVVGQAYDLGPAPIDQAGGATLNGLRGIGNVWNALETSISLVNRGTSNDDWIMVRGSKWWFKAGACRADRFDFERPLGYRRSKPPYGDPVNDSNGVRLASRMPSGRGRRRPDRVGDGGRRPAPRSGSNHS